MPDLQLNDTLGAFEHDIANVVQIEDYNTAQEGLGKEGDGEQQEGHNVVAEEHSRVLAPLVDVEDCVHAVHVVGHFQLIQRPHIPRNFVCQTDT